jgi:SAM-dependent methyltransferase
LRDVVLEAISGVPGRARVLDIGCGRGFDNDLRLQASIAAAAGSYVGVEPDPEVPLGPYFGETHRCLFEDAPLPPGSVDVAFAVMVLEHLRDPSRFWAKLFEVLAPGGVFLGFTMDARHWFCAASALAARLRVKDFYLNRVVGRRGEDRYENYPVYYRCNTPAQVAQYAGAFHSCEAVSFAKVGECDFYLPQFLRPIGHALDRRVLREGKPGSVLAVRAVK